MNTAITLLLQAATTILLSVGRNTALPISAREQAVNIAQHSIQLVTQAEAMPEINFTIPNNNDIYPNATDLVQTAYRGLDGKWVPFGKNLSIVDNSISFGDINNDGIDDAVVLVKRTASNGNSDYALAFMLNQNNILFNITDVLLGSSVQIFNHRITNNEFSVDLQIGNGLKKTYNYELLGNQAVQL